MSEFFQWFIGAGVAINIIISAFWLGGLNRQVKDIQKNMDRLPCLDPKLNKCSEVKK